MGLLQAQASARALLLLNVLLSVLLVARLVRGACHDRRRE